MAPHGNSGACTVGKVTLHEVSEAGSSSPTKVSARAARTAWIPWVAGVVLAVVMLGPALAPGPLFSLDQVLPAQVPVPRGVWGLGPELPRRVPMWLPVAWLSPIIGGDTAGKLLMIVTIALAFVGAHRLTKRMMGDDVSEVTAYAAALVYALNPFLLTRLGVGHLMVALPMAMLPWVLPILLRPADRPRLTFLAAFALGFSGHYGGSIAVLIVLIGLVFARGRRAGAVLGLTLFAQLPWVVPGLVIYSEGAAIVDATPFASFADGGEGLLHLVAGHGFWNPLYQVGKDGGWFVAVAGLVLVALAIRGTADIPGAIRKPMVVLAASGFVGAAASATPMGDDLNFVGRLQLTVSDLYISLTRNPVGSVMREGQRLLPLYLVWLAPAAALGARRLARSILARRRHGFHAPAAAMIQVVPIVVAVALASSAFWGIDSRLRPVQLPPEWEEARALVSANPGTVLALPWHQYFNLEVDGIRRVLNPLPLYLGGDVLVSSNPELKGQDRRERVDPREVSMDAIVGEIRNGTPVSDRLAKLGVRWIVVLHEVDWLSLNSLSREPGLERRLRRQYLDVYEVKDWRGLVVDGAGRSVPADPHVEPWTSVDASGPAVYQRAGQMGWMRGTAAAEVSPEGLVALPAGSGPVWFWPSLLVLVAAAATWAAVTLSVVSVWRENRRQRPDLPKHSPRDVGRPHSVTK